MRLQVIAVSSPLSGWLSNSGYELTTNNPDYQVTLRYEKREDIEITTGNSELEKLLVEKLKELGVKRFILNKEGELSDRSIKILIPEMTKYDIDRGVFRALGEFLRVGKSAKRRFISYLLPAVLLLLESNNLFAQDPWTFIRLWTSSGPVYAADFANNAMRISIITAPTLTISGTVTANQGTANATPWNENILQWGSTNTTLGQKAMTASVPVTLASDQLGNPDTVGTIVALNALNAAATVSLRGKSGANCVLSAGTLAGTVVMEFSPDSTVSWTDAVPFDGTTSKRLIGGQALTNPNAQHNYYGVTVGGATDIRLRVSAFTSGTANASCRAASTGDVFGNSVAANFVGVTAFGFPIQVGGADANGLARSIAQTNASPSNTEFRVVEGNIPSPTTLIVVAKSAANTAVTATLPAVASVFHYITWLRISHTCTAALAGTGYVDVTSTNLPGGATWSFGNACAIGANNNDVMQEYPSPIKSSVVNTNTTIVCPAIGAPTLCKIELGYYTGS